jgi:hypothetical protein
MKKFFSMLALTLVFTLTFSAFATGAAEPKTQDQPSSWASVDKARNLGFVTDEMNRSFQTPTTREEFCVVISTILIHWYDAPIDYHMEARRLTLPSFNDTDV